MNPNFPFNYSEEDEDESEVTQSGLSSFENVMFRHSKSIYLGSILNQQFDIFITGDLKYADASVLLLECRPSKTATTTLYDAYEYLESTHYLNYLISKKYGGSLFFDNIEMRLEISEVPQLVSSKIVIIAQCEEVPHLIKNVNLIQLDQRRSVDVLSDIPGCPIVSKITRSKSYYLPLLIYDITLTLNSDSMLDFMHINENLFYDVILSKYIEDATLEFYPNIASEPAFTDFNKRLLKIHFDIGYDPKMINIRMCCCPAVFQSNGELYNYVCIDSKIHTHSVEKIDDFSPAKPLSITSFSSFIQRVSSSSCTQLIPINIWHHGIVPYCADEEYHAYICSTILCTLSRPVNCSDCEGAGQVITNFREAKSNAKHIRNYWVTDAPTIIDMIEGVKIKLYGFVNVAALYSSINIKNLYSVIDSELSQLLHIKHIFPHDQEKSTFVVENCYQSQEECRYAIYEVIRTSNSTKPKTESDINNKKKRFRLFGGRK